MREGTTELTLVCCGILVPVYQFMHPLPLLVRASPPVQQQLCGALTSPVFLPAADELRHKREQGTTVTSWDDLQFDFGAGWTVPAGCRRHDNTSTECL